MKVQAKIRKWDNGLSLHINNCQEAIGLMDGLHDVQVKFEGRSFSVSTSDKVKTNNELPVMTKPDHNGSASTADLLGHSTAKLDLNPRDWRILQAILMPFQRSGIKFFAYGERVRGRVDSQTVLQLMMVGQLATTQRTLLHNALLNSDLPFSVELLLQQEIPEATRQLILQELVRLPASTVCTHLNRRVPKSNMCLVN